MEQAKEKIRLEDLAPSVPMTISELWEFRAILRKFEKSVGRCQASDTSRELRWLVHDIILELIEERDGV